MECMMMRILTDFGYIGMFFLITLENVFPPIPSEVVLAFGGFLTVHTDLEMKGMCLASVLGSAFGAILLYYAGRMISMNRPDCMTNVKWRRKFGFKEEEIKKAFVWFDKHENMAVLIGRCVPVIRSLISVPAGMACMPFGKFLCYTVLGSGAWNILFLSLGRKAGDSWYEIIDIVDRYSHLMFLILLISVCMYFLYKKRLKKG